MAQILDTGIVATDGRAGAPVSAASWQAIFAGAFVAAGVSVILLALGAGLGFASISPWQDRGVSGTTFAITTAIWLIVMQWVSSAVGGYIAGRLRTRWHGTHVHEVFFRDTAHGLVTWAVATVIIAVLVASSAFGALGKGVNAAADAASSGVHAMASAASPAADYGLDRLFRASEAGSSGQDTRDLRMQAAHIIANAASTGTVSDDDRTYLTNLVAAHTGLSQADAQKRVDDFTAEARDAEAKAKAAADSARKAAAEAAIYLALSMLVGAFVASVSAALGGRLRDEHG